MGKIMIINASPRAPRSNSKKYSALFSSCCRTETEYFEVKKTNHSELCREMGNYKEVVFVFPLYADSLPVTLLDFLKTLETESPCRKPVISVIINCGFIEPHQNDIAIEMLQYYCRTHGFTFGSVLKIGSGEAILTTPFQIFLKRSMKRFASSINTGKYKSLKVTMPIPKTMFLRASTAYWENYGKKNGVTKEEMATMKIE